MASNTEEVDPLSLHNIFGEAWELFDEIANSDQPTNSDELQRKIKQTCLLLENCTNLVSSIGLFSRNEHVDEVSTPSLQFLLLPAFLGELSLKKTTDDRKSNVQIAKTYFIDYLERCKCYSLISDDVNINFESSSQPKTLSDMNRSREEKIRIYKEKKVLREKYLAMRDSIKLKKPLDECKIRLFYIDSITLWVHNSRENLQLITDELQILEFMKNDKKHCDKEKLPKTDLKPRKPILITRDMIQKQVFGAGYRSLPTMTEDEWFQKELQEGKIVLDAPNEVPATTKDDSDDESDEKVYKQREWDDWKDTHRRGEGNKDRHG